MLDAPFYFVDQDNCKPFLSPAVYNLCAAVVPGLKRGRPLYLDKHRYTALKRLYLTHRIALEVSAIRASSDRVIRENFY